MSSGEFRKSKFVVLTASRYHENSSYTSDYEGYPVSHFTYWLWYGAVPYGSSNKMDADTDHNNLVTVKELYRFIKQYDNYDYYAQHVQMYSSSANYGMFRN